MHLKIHDLEVFCLNPSEGMRFKGSGPAVKAAISATIAADVGAKVGIKRSVANGSGAAASAGAGAASFNGTPTVLVGTYAGAKA